MEGGCLEQGFGKRHVNCGPFAFEAEKLNLEKKKEEKTRFNLSHSDTLNHC